MLKLVIVYLSSPLPKASLSLFGMVNGGWVAAIIFAGFLEEGCSGGFSEYGVAPAG